MEIPVYHVDAFTDRLFAGNPAAVCPLESWLDPELMQAIAAENALSETAFFCREGDVYGLRWFTPKAEVDLCGHATLASAWVLFECLNEQRERLSFTSRSGLLSVAKVAGGLSMDFPAAELEEQVDEPALMAALGAVASELHATPRDYLAVFGSQSEIAAIAPDMPALCQLKRQGIIVTAKGEEHDFVSRFFAPVLGVPEDPVTGSAHCALAVYWSQKLGKNKLRARQISARGGDVLCVNHTKRIEIIGDCVLFKEGRIRL